ncbi:MAG: hypothetical protein KDC92_17125, partial [Bacteroidetes bacterium]|nr:hypothetical protein [Bacteroidota bacterium]
MKHFVGLLALIGVCALFGCEEEKSEFTCNYYGLLSSSTTLKSVAKEKKHEFASSSDAIKVVDSILNQVGLARNFEIMPSDEVDNAAAIVFEEKRYILYNNEFMKLADEISNNSWASISIMAHEIGHHLQGHTLTQDGSRPPIELEADKFAGFVLARMGATLQDAQSAIMSLVSEQGSETHPKRSDRLLAIAEGFKNGSDKKKSSTIGGLVLKPITGNGNNDVRETDPTGNSIYNSLVFPKSKEQSSNASSTNLDTRYVGTHNFKATFIDAFTNSGNATITKTALGYRIEGRQEHKNGNWVIINGMLFNTTLGGFSFNGTIKVHSSTGASLHNKFANPGEEFSEVCSY